MTPLPLPETVEDEHHDGSPRFIRHEFIDWQGVRIRIEYEAEYLCGFMSHVSVYVVEPFKAPLPVTDTGYRSHFVDNGVVESFGGPAAFVKAWLDQETTSDEWRLQESKSRQRSLF